MRVVQVYRDIERARGGGSRQPFRFLRRIDIQDRVDMMPAPVRVGRHSEIRKAPEQWFWVHRRWAKDVYRV